MVTPDQVVAAAVAHMAGPWSWRDACYGPACDAFAALYGFDPMASVRGRFSTERGALLFVRRRGGMVECVSRILEPQGFTQSEAPGSLGVVPAPDAFGGAMAICVQPGVWARRARHGLAIVKCEGAAWVF